MPAASNTTGRVRVAPGIYRRFLRRSGAYVYEVRVIYRDAEGDRHERWETVGTSRTEAKRFYKDQASAAQHGRLAAKAGASLTVAEFLTRHFLPDMLERKVETRRRALATYNQYRRYSLQKVIPAIGRRRVGELTTGQVEKMLDDLCAGGRHPSAGMGRPRLYPEFVYAHIDARHSEGATFAAIAAELPAAHPEVCGTMTKDSIASIWRRNHTPRPSQTAPKGLDTDTVDNVYNMLRSAWRYGIKEELIPRNRAHIMAEVEPPQEAKDEPEPAIVIWQPEEYVRFFDWVIDARPDSGVAFYFTATSGDRRSGIVGLHWDDVDLEAATADMRCFVKDSGEPGTLRIIIETWAKETPGNTIFLDPRTVENLRVHKARQAAKLLARADRHDCETDQRDCPRSGYHDRGLVFPQRDGNYRDPDKFLTLLQDAIRAYNRTHPAETPLPVIHLHGLRHGWSTHARDAGVDELVRMDRLDQTTPAVNRSYTKVLDPARREAARIVSEFLFAGSGKLDGIGS